MLRGNSGTPILAQPRWWSKLVNFTFLTQKETERPFDQLHGRIVIVGLDYSGKNTFLNQCFEQQEIVLHAEPLGIFIHLHSDQGLRILILLRRDIEEC
jgi:hypothetical protein